MKKVSLLAFAVVAIIAVEALGAGLALATTTTTHHAAAPKTLKIAMHDPGCHWFMRNGRYTTKATVTGSVRLVNLDEATLKVASRSGTQRIRVGKSLVVGHGIYRITMVGQAPDDNHLRLTVVG